MICPACDIEMDRHARHGVTIDHCPGCGGVWLDPGELDHLIAAIRPSVVLPDPAPEPVRPAAKPPRAAARPAKSEPKPETGRPRDDRGGSREAGTSARAAPRADKPRRTPGSARRYERRYSNRARLKDILDEIFDFD